MGMETHMAKTISVVFVACMVLGACGGGSSSTRQGSHPDQGTAAPHIECGTSAGHHGGGCGDGTSGGAATTDGTAPADGTTAPATDADAGTTSTQ